MPFIKPENIEPQEDSPAEIIMNKSSAATAIHTPAGCLATNAAAFFVSSAVFFAALRVFSAAFCAGFRPVAHFNFFRQRQGVLHGKDAVYFCLCALWGVGLEKGGEVGR